MKDKILNKYRKLLNREVNNIIHFNDVFSEQEIDFDAILTVIFRNIGNTGDLTFPIGKNPELADYGVSLLNELFQEQNRILSIINKKFLKEKLRKTTLSVINNAPRNKETTKNGKNGTDFYLAITDNGLEIYTTPLERLQILETQNRILALYQIPNENLKITDGKKEQFRSSIIATTRYFPEIFVPIFQYKNVNELIKAKNENKHPKVIGEINFENKVVFVDKFGNTKIFVKNLEKFKLGFKNKKIGDIVKIKVGNSDFIDAYYATCLKEIPNNSLGIYENISDNRSKYSKAGFWEIVKKSENPNQEIESAKIILEKLSKNFMNEEIYILS